MSRTEDYLAPPVHPATASTFSRAVDAILTQRGFRPKHVPQVAAARVEAEKTARELLAVLAVVLDEEEENQDRRDWESSRGESM